MPKGKYPPPFVECHFGHKVRVPSWPSMKGTATLQRHYRRGTKEERAWYIDWLKRALATAIKEQRRDKRGRLVSGWLHRKINGMTRTFKRDSKGRFA
jgi:hypothetical protein